MLWIFVIFSLLVGSMGCRQPQASLPGGRYGGLVSSYIPKVAQTFERHKEELYQLPGVTSVAYKDWSIRVYTNNPTVVPEEIDGVRVRTFPAWGGTVPTDEQILGPVLGRHEEGLRRLPGVQNVRQREDTIYIYTENPAAVPEVVEGIPIRVVPPQANSSLLGVPQ